MLTKSTAGQIAGPTGPTNLVLEPLPNGEYAWLRPWLGEGVADVDQVDQFLTRLLERRPEPQPQPEREERVALTDLGRRALAMERLFGHWPRLVDSVCCGCSAILQPGVNIHYRMPDGRTHCDGCATAGDVEYQPTMPPAEAVA